MNHTFLIAVKRTHYMSPRGGQPTSTLVNDLEIRRLKVHMCSQLYIQHVIASRGQISSLRYGWEVLHPAPLPPGIIDFCQPVLKPYSRIYYTRPLCDTEAFLARSIRFRRKLKLSAVFGAASKSYDIEICAEESFLTCHITGIGGCLRVIWIKDGRRTSEVNGMGSVKAWSSVENADCLLSRIEKSLRVGYTQTYAYEMCEASTSVTARFG